MIKIVIHEKREEMVKEKESKQQFVNMKNNQLEVLKMKYSH